MDFGTLCSGTIPFGQWAFYTFIVLLITSIFYAFMYLLSKLLNNTKLCTQIGHEIMQMFYTAGLFVLIVLLISGICTFDIGTIFDKVQPGYINYYNKDGVNTYDFAMGYLKKLSEWSFESIAITTLSYSYISSLGGASIKIKTHTIQPYKGLKAIADSFLGLGAMSLIIVFLSAVTQMFILYYIWSPLVGVFMPIGFLFRSFAPTRTIGGAIIGAVLTLMVFYPLLLNVNGLVMHTVNPEKTLGFMKLTLAGVVGSWMTLMLATVGERSMSNPMIAGWLHKYLGVKNMGKYAAFFSSLRRTASTILYILIMAMTLFFVLALFSVVGILFLAGVLMPLLNILILSHISTALSSLLGESLNIANLTRMI